ncbi:MAG: hypothetical protein ACM35G_00195, partial [Planctomycetaceae bacterium]
PDNWWLHPVAIGVAAAVKARTARGAEDRQDPPKPCIPGFGRSAFEYFGIVGVDGHQIEPSQGCPPRALDAATALTVIQPYFLDL